MKGIVSKSTGSWYKVFIEGEEVDARLRGKFRTQDLKSTNPVTVGDHVVLEKDGEDYAITEIDERKNCIVRKSNKLSKQFQLIASNIDFAYLIITPGQPYTPQGFIDRYLVSAEAYQIPVKLLINKNDQTKAKFQLYREQLLNLYTSIGYECRSVSFMNQSDINAIADEINGKTCLFGGNSGVGKSTLINALLEQSTQKIGAISDSYHKGKHTTTFAQMFSVNKNSFIIDTPGIKDFGLVHIEKQQLSHYFPEMKALLSECKFNNCLHLEEPHCAINKALDAEQLPASRYINYLSMLEEIAAQTKNQ